MEFEQESQQDAGFEEDAYANLDDSRSPEAAIIDENPVMEEANPTAWESTDHQKPDDRRTEESLISISSGSDRSGFIHGLSVGLGIGCVATFIIMWITVFFSPRLPSTVTYEAMLSIFIYPLVYLLAVGLIALTAGIVREYYNRSIAF